MPIPIPIPLIEFILLGPLDDRRQLQDSPILGDVWVAYGLRPAEPADLLIAPYKGQHAGSVAHAIDKAMGDADYPVAEYERAGIATLQGLIVAKLTFRELMVYVTPKTKWWLSRRVRDEYERIRRDEGAAGGGGPQTTADAVDDATRFRSRIKVMLGRILTAAVNWHRKLGHERLQELPTLERFLTLMALIHWAASAHTRLPPPFTVSTQIGRVLGLALQDLDEMARMLAELTGEMLKDETQEAQVWQVSRNRPAVPAISKSVPAVKADAATTLFKVDCSEIAWAVLDSGIDGKHPAFRGRNGECRVKRSFDFKHFRRLVSLGNSRRAIRERNIEALLADKDTLRHQPKWGEEAAVKAWREQAHRDLERLAEDVRDRGPVHWGLVEKYVEIKPDTPPRTNHGTHVAGIIGASREAAQKAADAAAKKEAAAIEARRAAELEARRAEEVTDAAAVGYDDADEAEKAAEGEADDAAEEPPAEPKANEDFADGMCPDITLYDFRVLGRNVEDTEFNVIAALQFIRYLNGQDNFLAIHGANLSLSIPHDVRNFACGRTPVCDECEQLVASGVVVVAAAGNHGYKSFETKEGAYDSYAAFSITDPGNADGVLTVGATHRFWPHTYGVSFFSSRGPTGDGRLKPDLVAPGERIRAPLPGNHDRGGDWGDLDGTSMAAPHVSGAAAMLMARYSELIGQPRRVKRILCETATDLGRERSFQGHGMLDVLRAFQSI